MEMGFDEAAVNKALKGLDNGPKTGGSCSFSGDTLVQTKDGLKPINQLKIGDIVFAYNEQTTEFDWYPITAVWIEDHDVIVYLVIDGELIITTSEHPFFTESLSQVSAGELQVGDQIWQGILGSGRVEAVLFVSNPQVMYNLTVDQAHTFFVGDGAWLVHNTCKWTPHGHKLSHQKICLGKILSSQQKEGLQSTNQEQI